MTTWPKDELREIAESDELHVSPFREDGRTYGTLHGFRPSGPMTQSTCVRTTVRTRAGIR